MEELKILIVDDEKDFSDSVSDYFKSLGYKVFHTYTGKDALDILNKEKPDVMLCDLKLGGMNSINGDDVLNKLKSASPRTIPIIVTAYHDEAIQKRLSAKGVRKLLFKPIMLEEIDKLLSEIKGELNKKQA